MQNTVNNSMQAASENITALSGYGEDASIWHHMSEALHQSLYRVLTLLIAVLPEFSRSLSRCWYSPLPACSFPGFAPMPVVGEVRSAHRTKERHRLGPTSSPTESSPAHHSGCACCSVSLSVFRLSIRRMQRAHHCPSPCCRI